VQTGVKYEEASKIYEAMESIFADAIVSGQKVNIGRVLSIKPIKKKARKVNMGFAWLGKHNRTIHLGNRIAWKVSVFKEFLNKHELNWRL
jgi:hypothetical protein